MKHYLYVGRNMGLPGENPEALVVSKNRPYWSFGKWEVKSGQSSSVITEESLWLSFLRMHNLPVPAIGQLIEFQIEVTDLVTKTERNT